METRKITVVSTKTQKKSVIMSNAETLAELKRDLDAANIEYDDMTFYEGVSKTELKTDESVLPKDVPYTNRTTGETKNTNELVFLLTNTNKKIKSGAINADRLNAYATIKAVGLQQACIDKYGKNFTQCPTKDLVALIEENTENTTTEITPNEEVAPNGCECECPQIRRAVCVLVNTLYEENVIDTDTYEEVYNALNGEETTCCNPGPKSSYSDHEINSMMEDLL